MGAVFRCPVWTCGLEELRALLTKSGLPLYGAALRSDTVDVRRADFSHCAVAVGSEGKGLSADALAACDLTVRIPMSGHCESLNAAAAAPCCCGRRRETTEEGSPCPRSNTGCG